MSNTSVPPAAGANVPDAQRAAVATVLACSIQPFQFGDLFRASCGDLNFETTSDAVRAEAHARLQRDCHLGGVFSLKGLYEVGVRNILVMKLKSELECNGFILIWIKR